MSGRFLDSVEWITYRDDPVSRRKYETNTEIIHDRRIRSLVKLNPSLLKALVYLLVWRNVTDHLENRQRFKLIFPFRERIQSV